MRDDALTYFKANVQYNCRNYLNLDNHWIFEKYTEGSPFLEFKLEVPNFELDMTSERPENTDYNNVKILYSALKGISDTQASDERFWAGLSHGDLWDFMQYRCKLTNENITENKVLTNFFFNYGNKRSLIVNPLSRLWWVGRLIFDETSSNPYRALEYMKIDFGTKVLSLFSSNYTNNPVITRAVLSAIIDLENNGNKIGRNDYLEIIRYVNVLGGIIVLDYLSEVELKNKIIKHYYEQKKGEIV